MRKKEGKRERAPALSRRIARDHTFYALGVTFARAVKFTYDKLYLTVTRSVDSSVLLIKHLIIDPRHLPIRL